MARAKIGIVSSHLCAHTGVFRQVGGCAGHLSGLNAKQPSASLSPTAAGRRPMAEFRGAYIGLVKNSVYKGLIGMWDCRK